MSLSQRTFEQYKHAVNISKNNAVADLQSALQSAWVSSSRSKSNEEFADILINYSRALVQKYGEAAASVSASMWEEIYFADTGARAEALIPEFGSYDEFMGDAARAVLKERLDRDDYNGAYSFLAGVTSKAVHDWARKTQISNSRRVVNSKGKGYRSARFMRVPVGETCAWCIMLASRGPVYLSEFSAGGGPEHTTEFDSFHAYCDCDIVASFDDNPNIGGYDWHIYESWYRDALAYNENGTVDLKSTLAQMRLDHGLK